MEALLSTQNPLSKKGYFFGVLIIEVLRLLLMFAVVEYFKADHHLVPLSYFVCISIYAFTTGMLLMLTIRCRKVVAAPSMMTLLILIPGVNYLGYFYFLFLTRERA